MKVVVANFATTYKVEFLSKEMASIRRTMPHTVCQ